MKTRILSGLLAVCLTPVVAMAAIEEVSINPSPAKAGEEAFVTVTGDARQSRCGLSVEFGDGEVRDIKIDTKEGLFPRTLTKAYAKPGAYAIAVTGKSIFRGFNSYSPCEGRGMTAVTVAPGDAVAMAAVTPPPAKQPAVPLPVKPPIEPVLPPPTESLSAKPSTETPILRIDPGEHTSSILRSATDAAGRWLATVSFDKTARVWDLGNGRLVSTLRPPIYLGGIFGAAEGILASVAISPDGRTVAVGGTITLGEPSFSVLLFERASGRLLPSLTGLSGVPNSMVFSPDGRSLAVTVIKAGLHLFDVADGYHLIAKDGDYGGGNAHNAHFSTDGRLITTSAGGLLRLYRFEGSRLNLLAKRVADGGKQPGDARFSPDGKRIAVGFRDSTAVDVLDGNSLNLLFSYNATGVIKGTSGIGSNFGEIAWSQDGKWLYTAGAEMNGDKQEVFIRRWAGSGTGIASNWLVGAGNSMSSLLSLPGGQLAFSTIAPSWGVVKATGERQFFHAPAIVNSFYGHGALKISRGGERVGFSYEQSDKFPAIFDSMQRKFIADGTSELVPALSNAPGIDLTDLGAGSFKLNGKQFRLNDVTATVRIRSSAIRPDGTGFVLGTDISLHSFDRMGKQIWRKLTSHPTLQLNVSQDGRWIVAAYNDGTIRWHRASDGAEQLAFYPHPDKKRWVLWTPSGYYDASPSAEDLIGWHLNRGKNQAADFFPASRFRKTFYRPDVIARILETVDEAKALQLANQETGRDMQVVSIVQALPPVVEILSPQSGFGASSTDVTVKVAIRSPADAPATATRVRVNGLLQTDSRNLQVKAADDIRAITVTLPQQDAEIQIFAENKNGVSTPATLHVTWAGKKAAPAQEDNRFKPKLYVLAVGVSKYQNKDYNLDLAAKDARDFAAVFQKQDGKLYGKVTVRLLTDDKATKDGVLDGLEWLKREVTSRDVGVMFLAGHGMNDNTGNYFFLPHNVDINQLVRTGVGENDIKITLNALAGKAIFFVDSCHSGNALGTAKTRGITDVNAFVSELASAENGVIVFTASTGRQLSQESPSWGNGVFTKAVVEGLGGKADFQKNGKITHKGLDYYVTERVKELTKGQQSPVSIAPGGITDFPIAFAVGKQ
jgi:WD40 repeat protein/uncharacterized caspase-like protein